MVKAVLEHTVAALQQRGEDAGIGHVAAGIHQRARPAGEICERLFQLLVRRTVTTDQMGRAAANPVLLRRVAKSFYHTRMRRQSQIIIAAKIQVLAIADAHPRALRGIQRDALPVQAGLAAPRQHRAEAIGKDSHDFTLGRGGVVKLRVRVLRGRGHLPTFRLDAEARE